MDIELSIRLRRQLSPFRAKMQLFPLIAVFDEDIRDVSLGLGWTVSAYLLDSDKADHGCVSGHPSVRVIDGE